MAKALSTIRATPNRPPVIEHHGEEETQEQIQRHRRRMEIIRYFREQYLPQLAITGAAAPSEEDELAQSLAQFEHADHVTQEDLKGWEWFKSFSSTLLINAHEVHTKFFALLNQATTGPERLISDESKRRWIERYRNARFKEVEYFLNYQFPQFLEEWKKVVHERKELLQNSQIRTLHRDDVPEIAQFLDEETFLNLKYAQKKNLIAYIRSALQSKKLDLQSLYRDIHEELRQWSSGANRFLSPVKVGIWLDRIFRGEYSIKARRAFIMGTLGTYKKEWMKVRAQFDVIRREMQIKGIPQGFWLVDLDEFLGWPYAQRRSYITEASGRLGTSHEKEEPTLKYIKMDIRHDLDSKDWDGAERLIQHAKEKYPYDLDIASMATFLEHHRNDNPQEHGVTPDLQNTLREMRSMVSKLPSSLQRLYVQAMSEGYAVFRALTVLMYNRVWLHEKGRYLSEEGEVEQVKNRENKKKTRTYMTVGHSQEIEYNIVSGDTAEEGAIREEDPTAQVVFMGSGGDEAVLSHARKQRHNQEDGARGFLYQTSVIPIEVNYSTHKQIVEHYHYPLKRGLRLLEELGIPFTLTGKV
ncbi:hypothetical protein A2635_05400 [Candidatus Peribacteria bacterium RIFCSPHIGHO2_01_FULL_51_9]|nr:MAG: hypothetical protein A2635_05400 [Candidatus Peribacteria bacterium RIFCSPHIGHO2_01_FULL_51_9]